METFATSNNLIHQNSVTANILLITYIGYDKDRKFDVLVDIV